LGIRDERLAAAARMPHRAFAGENCLDTRLESELGRIFYRNLISLEEFEAGVRYCNIVLEYLRTTDAPEPYGNEYVSSVDDGVCLRRALSMSAAKEVLRDVGPCAGRVVDRVVVYDGELRDGELNLLRAALRALAGK
jgi:hypothetical protein